MLSFGQSQTSIIYTQLNQYYVVLEVAPQYSQSPEGLKKRFTFIRMQASNVHFHRQQPPPSSPWAGPVRPIPSRSPSTTPSPAWASPAFVKRLVHPAWPRVATHILILGDHQTRLHPRSCSSSVGRPSASGRGLDRIKPLGKRAARLGACGACPGERARQLRLETCAGGAWRCCSRSPPLVRGRPLSNGEEVILGPGDRPSPPSTPQWTRRFRRSSR